MRLVRLYQKTLVENSEFLLDAPAHHHVSRVLKMRTGDALELIDGSGSCYPAVILRSDKQTTAVQTTAAAPCPAQPRLPLHLFIALLKGSAMDWTLQKAVELGATAITPLATARSERKLTGERWEKKAAHWQGIFIASALQCGRAEWPALHKPIAPEEAAANAAVNWIFSPHDSAASAPAQAASAAVMIGPEGGFTEAEVQAAIANGWQPRLLGKRILRADTAAAAALTAVQLQYGDF